MKTKLDEAAKTYEENIKRAEKLEDFRQVAVGKTQLASVRLLQSKYEEALAGYEGAREIFEQQNEPASVAVIWHQIGVVHQDAGNYDKAETAYRDALEIDAQTNNQAGQAGSLVELGRLYNSCLNRPEEAVTFYRQAADICMALEDVSREGLVRNNIANTLLKLKRYDEARTEIERAIELGWSEIWKSFGILQQIETATGNSAAARTAWQQARDAYLAYRQQGGYAQYYGGKLVDYVLELMAQQPIDAIQSDLNQLANNPNTPDSIKQLIQAMVTILNSSRDPSLADAPALDYEKGA